MKAVTQAFKITLQQTCDKGEKYEKSLKYFACPSAGGRTLRMFPSSESKSAPIITSFYPIYGFTCGNGGNPLMPPCRLKHRPDAFTIPAHFRQHALNKRRGNFYYKRSRNGGRIYKQRRLGKTPDHAYRFRRKCCAFRNFKP